MHQSLLWSLFGAAVVLLLTLDLGLFRRKEHSVTFREAACRSSLWVLMAVLFAIVVFQRRGSFMGMRFVAGYLIELSLSVDNVFLFGVIFAQFRVPPAYQHRVLFWGILGAMLLRGLMIVAGTALLHRFESIIYVFGVFLILTGLKLLLNHAKTPRISENRLLDWLRRRLRFTSEFDGQQFLTRKNGLLFATPLLLVLVLVEVTDVVFALDSIPAIFALFQHPEKPDPFIVFTSNVFAILGLRSFYFLLANAMGLLYYLPHSLSAILVFVGFKMLALVPISIVLSLGIITGLLTAGILASLWRARRVPRQTPH